MKIAGGILERQAHSLAPYNIQLQVDQYDGEMVFRDVHSEGVSGTGNTADDIWFSASGGFKRSHGTNQPGICQKCQVLSDGGKADSRFLCDVLARCLFVLIDNPVDITE